VITIKAIAAPSSRFLSGWTRIETALLFAEATIK
jgi:hypothetical protein